MRYALLVLAGALAACSSSSSSKNDIAPDGTLSDGGKFTQTPSPSDTSIVTRSKPGENASGTRIKTKSYVGSDGSKQFIGFYDSERKEDCSWSPTADGQTRCVPAGVGFSGWYGDSGCTQKIYGGGACAATATYVIVADATPACTPATGSRIYARGDAYTPQAFYSGTPASCSKFPYALPGVYYQLGAEVAASSFVGATTQTE